jgi:hypothetical protein
MFLFGLMVGFLLPEWQDLPFRTLLIVLFWFTIPPEWKHGGSSRPRAVTAPGEERSDYPSLRMARPRYARRYEAGHALTATTQILPDPGYSRTHARSRLQEGR